MERTTCLELQTAVTCAPNARAIWTANVPTPPDAPLIKTRCPCLIRPWSRSACSAVLPATTSTFSAAGEPGPLATTAFIFTAVETMTMPSAQPERRVLIGHQRERVGIHPVGPPEHADDKTEQAAGIRAGEENREPRRHDRDRRA